MCTSNTGNRRPFPTNGFKSRGGGGDGAVVVDAVKSSIATTPSKNSSSSQPAASLHDHHQHHHHTHIQVQHHYHDHANDFRGNYQEDQPARGGVTTPFPLKLHDMLQAVSEADEKGEAGSSSISWQPHGRCFVVHDSKAFVSDVLPKYMKLSKLASFQRQLNLYGFQRITKGADRGGYYHELFLKGRVFLAHSIVRQKVKGTGVRARSNPAQEPHFYAMPYVTGGEEMNVDTTMQHRHVSDASSSSSSSSAASPVPSSPMHDNTGLPASFWKQQFPLHLEPASFPESCHDEEELFGKHFFDVSEVVDAGVIKKQPEQALMHDAPETLLSEDVDAFFEDFDFPDDIGNEIEDDAVFGSLLEQMLVS